MKLVRRRYNVNNASNDNTSNVDASHNDTNTNIPITSTPANSAVPSLLTLSKMSHKRIFFVKEND